VLTKGGNPARTPLEPEKVQGVFDHLGLAARNLAADPATALGELRVADERREVVDEADRDIGCGQPGDRLVGAP